MNPIIMKMEAEWSSEMIIYHIISWCHNQEDCDMNPIENKHINSEHNTQNPLKIIWTNPWK